MAQRNRFDVASHLQTVTLENYLLTRLKARAVVRAECHLLICEACRVRTNELAAMMFDLKDAVKPLAMAAGGGA